MEYVGYATLLFMVFLAILAIAALISPNPYVGVPKPKQQNHLTIDEIRKLNHLKALKAAKEIEAERGKVLAFKRKLWYKSTKRGKHDV